MEATVEDGEVAIFDAAYECLTLFERISKTYDESVISTQFVMSDTLLTTRGKTKAPPSRDLLGLRNSFALWADYTGALSLKQASLDTRLKGLNDISSMVIELLDMMLRNLRRLEEPPQVNTSQPGDIHEGLVSPLPGLQTELLAKLEVVVQAVDAALNRLHYLATAIRKASAKRLEYDVASFLNDEDIIFRKDARLVVARRFPNARKALCEQLGDSIAVRRRMLLRKNRHAKKLAIRRTPEPEAVAAALQQMQLTPAEQMTPKRAIPTARFPNVSPSTIATWASRPDPDAKPLRRLFSHAKPALSSVVSIVSETAEDSFDYPRPPRPKEGEKHVQCPYCLKPLETAQLKQKNKAAGLAYWTHHLDEDLQPYVCLFPECAKALVFFNRRQEWRAHMESTHKVDWPRRVQSTTWYCDVGHDLPEQFEAASTWRDHMKGHTSRDGRPLKPPSEAQLDAMSSRMQQVVLREKWVCPLCERVPERIEPIAEKGNPSDLAQLLSEHIASHVKSLSLLSLPCFDAEADDDDDADRESVRFGGSSRRRRGSGSSPLLPSGHDDFSSYLSSFASSKRDDLDNHQLADTGADENDIDMDEDSDQPPVKLPDDPSSGEWLQEWREWRDDKHGINDLVEELDPVLAEFAEAQRIQRMEEEERRLQEQRGPQVKPLPCRYRTGKTIGDSTYSILKECRHIESGRYFVTQLYRKDDLTGQEYKMRTAIKVLKSVSQGNKNIVTLEDYFETLQNLYLVLEYYSGETLFDKIERLGYIDESTAAHIIANILDGTIYLHSLGIAHRNLKAANIVFKTNINETDIRIGDFFDAMYVDDETAVFQEVGSPQYKAPEVVEERPHGTPCDIWSIGVITYFTLTGRRPFDHAEDADLDQAIVSGGYSFTPEEEWKNIHPSAKDFINRCLIFDPVERITAQEARKHKWMRHWDLWPVVAQPDGNNGGDGIADTESSEDDEVEIEGDEAIATESMDVSDLPTPDPEEDKIRVEEDERGAAEKQEDETVATDSPDAGDVAMPDPDSDSPEHV